ncbi:MAG: folylpolyglutamate synthase/dihydrofolate synthase family protein [Anaerolineaceae bacterium]
MKTLEKQYQESLDYLYSFVDYSLTKNLQFSEENFDLSRMRDLLARMGNPERHFKSIHVAGTKGKGSTAALIASAIQEAGYKIGFYTSPHLIDYSERIQIDGQPILAEALVSLLDEMKPAIEAIMKLTTFEITTALAFQYFAREGAELAVIEVGLGGRLDATNVIDPMLSVITSISHDHMGVLGNTLAQIAGEKAGIIKPGRPVVTAPQTSEAIEPLVKAALENQAPLTMVGREYFFSGGDHNLDHQTLRVWKAADQPAMDGYIEGEKTVWQPVTLTIPLLGYHQIVNAATAYAALETARKKGLKIQEESIRRGFEKVSWPGRFEVLRKDPPVIVDSAHNRDSALKLRLALDDYLPGVPVILIFGASEDKDIAGMFTELLPRVKRIIATQSIHPRAMDANKLVELAHQFGCPAKAVLPIEEALKMSLELADGDEKGSAVVVAGSLFAAAAVRDTWFNLRSENNQD